MAATTDPRRLCPTRDGGAHSLIAHWITPATCLERQRSNYHKCFTCRYRGLDANAILPPLAGAPPVKEAKEPRKRAAKTF